MCRCLLASRSRVHVCNTLIHSLPCSLILFQWCHYQLHSSYNVMTLCFKFHLGNERVRDIDNNVRNHRLALESLPPLPLPWRIKRRKIRRTIIIESILISVSFFLYYGFNTLLPPSPVSSGLKKSILESFSTLFNVASSKSFIYHHMRSQNDCQCIPLVE